MVEDPLPLPEVLDRGTALSVHEEVLRRIDGGAEVVLDFGPVKHADSFGAAALVECFRAARARSVPLKFRNVSAEMRALFAFVRADEVAFADESRPARDGPLARLGGAFLAWRDTAIQLAALNLDGLYYSFVAPFRGRGASRAHLFRQINSIGSGSLGIVTMISFLIGLIMALQSASQLRQFGANIYVADLVGIVMTRELGPLITAVILAARSGSSIAAELGTMVVTEEVDALTVLAIEPKRFLVAPRYLAMAIALPCLTTVADLAGVAGGFVVGTFGLDIGFTHYLNETLRAVLMKDLVTGLAKSLVFANVIAVVCCHMGLRLRGGPEEVGRATTRAVVLSIVLVIVADSLFTALFYLLG
jgi:phospholipid/cholesterol/gamma-HCH transport system permease protein